jgi:predicted unusual protein kinase regulating ubiquinone biosynthesis (AarF/ABC1/UbiB family)
MITSRRRRFLAQAGLVARLYAHFKWLQVRGRAGWRVTGADWHRAHRRGADLTYRTAVALEGLPIKVCQFLGSRADVLPDEYVEMLSRLQDRVPPRPLAALQPAVEDAIGCPLSEAFRVFDAEPIAAASLAQVHRAELPDGREVAVKIQYPEIDRVVHDDIRNFAVLVRVLARLERNFDFRVLVDEVTGLVPLELDFANEARNAERVARDLAARDDVLVPAVVWELTSRRVLVTQYAPGLRVTDVAGLRAAGIDPQDVARRLSDVFAQMILVHGFFHGDPHPGNILVQPGGRLVLLDFGLAKALPDGFRRGMLDLTLAIMRGDPRAVAAGFRALGFRTRDDSDDTLAVLGEAFLGYAMRNGQAYADPALLAKFNDEVPEALKANPLTEIPGDVLLVGRVMGLLSGIGKQLESEVDPTSVLLPYLADLASVPPPPA